MKNKEQRAQGDCPSDNSPTPSMRQGWSDAARVFSLGQAIKETRRAVRCSRPLFAYYYSYRHRLLLLALLSPVKSIAPLLTPSIMQLLIDKAYPARDFRLLAFLCAALLALDAISTALAVASGYLSTYIQSLLQCKLSLRVFNAIQRLPQSYREEHGAGMFLVRAGGDVQVIAQSITRVLPQIAAIAFTFIVAVPLMMRLSVGITLIILAVVPINYLITVHLTSRVMNLNEAAKKMAEELTTVTSENIEGATIARLFSLNRLRRKRLGRLLRERLRITFTTWRTGTFWGGLSSSVRGIWGATLLCVGWYLVFCNRLQLGQAVALGMYINILTRPFEQLATLYQSLLMDSVAARRLLEIFDVSQTARHDEAYSMLTSPPQSYEFRNLSFAYRDRRFCLHDIDLRLQAGRMVAVIGPSGAGKSTLIRILCGLDDRYQGRFLVDGRDFRKISRDSYLRHVSLVPQTNFFFSGSIRDNLPGNGSTSVRRLQECAAILGLDTTINSTSAGFDTKLGWEGIRLSAGQYQKLAALRAILKDASILLLDELTASMDIESERKLLQGIVALRRPDCLTLLVTHHISITTEPWVDEIIVLVDGRIVERGSCAELREKCGFYHHWLSLSKGIPSENPLRLDELWRQEH